MGEWQRANLWHGIAACGYGATAMKRSLQIAATTAAAVLMTAATATAWTPATIGIEAAAEHWQQLPCDGQIVVRSAPPSWFPITDTGPAAAAAVLPCTVMLNDYSEPIDGWATDPLTPGEVCALMVHEVGHLLGHKHTNTGVMVPTITNWQAIQACVTRLAFVRRYRRGQCLAFWVDARSPRGSRLARTPSGCRR